MDNQEEIKALKRRILELRSVNKNAEDVYRPLEVVLGKQQQSSRYVFSRSRMGGSYYKSYFYTYITVKYKNYIEEAETHIEFERNRPIQDELEAYQIALKYLARLRRRADKRRSG